MKTLTVAEASTQLNELLDEVMTTHEPALIIGRRANAVLIAEEDWRAIEETIALLSLPGMRESIVAELETPIEECSDEVEW